MRQKPAGGREEEPVGPRHRRTAGSSPEDGEFVPKHDDFQVFEVVRSNVQDSELKNPPKNDVQAAKVVAQIMGHTKVDTTMNVYTQVLDGAARSQRIASDQNCSELFRSRMDRRRQPIDEWLAALDAFRNRLIREAD